MIRPAPDTTGPAGQLCDFEQVYAADSDPFGVGTRWYEQRKLTLALACLTRARYRLAWDTACGTGHLAVQLARRCDHLVATDISPTAARSTQARLGEAEVCVGLNTLPAVPRTLQDHPPDLVVLSEVLYYLPRSARETLVGWCAQTEGEVLAVHWHGHPHDGFLSGVEVHEETGRILAEAGWRRAVAHGDTGFVLDVWTGGDADPTADPPAEPHDSRTPRDEATGAGGPGHHRPQQSST